ncbi:uncharacterized protein LOC118801257 isoform X3 [Colossoma macropomum]|uniref:uncharacterized protein LOC118801257 isoform X3 n=1 Tax=Colossoma macropomum TaxID=42526 RepID=UPI001864FE08|nr:uncharacterized protein LOC118801257 isoform X3 [Colossoma macropomum]
MSGGDQIHSSTEEPCPDFPRVYRAVAAARRQLFTGSPSTSTGSTLLSSVRSSFCRRIRSNSMTPGERRGRGRKPGLKWQVKFFLLQDPNQTTVPNSLDSKQLDKSGLANDDLGDEMKTIDLSWSLTELNTFICQSFASLNVTGFRLARATKRKKLLVAQANSVKDLKRQIGRSRIYILPNSHLPLYRQAAASLSQSGEGRSSASSAAETRNSPVLPQLCQVSPSVHSETATSASASVESNVVDLTGQVDENNGHIYVNAGTPEVFYRTDQPIQDVTTSQNSRTDQASLSENTLEDTLMHCPLTSSPVNTRHEYGGVCQQQQEECLIASSQQSVTYYLTVNQMRTPRCCPLQNAPIVPEMENLADIIRDFKRENISEHATLTVVARRRRILHSAITALNKGYSDWHKRPQIEFVGEMADDYGGPTREFFRLLMKDLQSTLGIFEGQPGNLFFFSYDQAALDKGKYYTGGKLICLVSVAWGTGH